MTLNELLEIIPKENLVEVHADDNCEFEMHAGNMITCIKQHILAREINYITSPYKMCIGVYLK